MKIYQKLQILVFVAFIAFELLNIFQAAGKNEPCPFMLSRIKHLLNFSTFNEFFITKTCKM